MTRKILSFLFLAVGVLVVIAMLAQTVKDHDAISAEKTLETMHTDTNTVVLDVRTGREYNGETGHLAGAKWIPVQELESRMAELEPWKGKTVIVYCRTENRSRRAVSLLREQGFSALRMEGGIVRWNQLDYPVVIEKDR